MLSDSLPNGSMKEQTLNRRYLFSGESGSAEESGGKFDTTNSSSNNRN